VVTDRTEARVAILGCGAIGELVGRQVYGRGDLACEVVAAIDSVPDRAATVAGLTGGRSFACLADALDAVTLDAVDIRLPHAMHADAAVEAARHGLHVLVEKPLATSPADARRILGAVAEAGVTLAVAENYPHLGVVRAARAAIDQGVVGEVVALRSTRAFELGGVWTRDGWRLGAGRSAGVLVDQGTHHSSLLRALAGEIVSVSAVPGPHPASRSAGDPGRDTVMVSSVFAGGQVAQSLYCWVTPDVAGDCEATVFGTLGRLDLHVDYVGHRGRLAVWARSAGGSVQPGERREDPATLGGDVRELAGGEHYYDSHRAIVADWLDAMASGHPPVVGGADALRDVEVVCAAARSLHLDGAFVEVPVG
jgi:predicted dehydrogenase